MNSPGTSCRCLEREGKERDGSTAVAGAGGGSKASVVVGTERCGAWEGEEEERRAVVAVRFRTKELKK